MKRLILTAGLTATVLLASCGSDGVSEPTTQSGEKDNTANAKGATDPMEGTWHTEIACAEMVRALKGAGVSKSVSGVVKDEFGLNQPPKQSDPCAGVDHTADHTLRFEGGHFALFAGEEVGWEASYELIDDNTFVTAPPDAVTFDFRIDGNKLYTQIVKPVKQAPYIATWESAPWERES
jgi:hypothetical protein